MGSLGDLSGSSDHPISRCKSNVVDRRHSQLILLCSKSPGDQSIQVFSMVISLVTIGSIVVTVNAKLLGGRVSFFQSLVSVVPDPIFSSFGKLILSAVCLVCTGILLVPASGCRCDIDVFEQSFHSSSSQLDRLGMVCVG
jgi:hypothetical protein